eukprot:4736089-Prymnesium_polylepis.1
MVAAKTAPLTTCPPSPSSSFPSTLSRLAHALGTTSRSQAAGSVERADRAEKFWRMGTLRGDRTAQ